MRRAVLILAAVLCVAAALGAGLWSGARKADASVPASRVRLVLQWSPQAQFAGYYVALEKGFYRQQGLDVEIIPGGPAIDSLAYLQGGKAEFATAFLTGAVTAAADGRAHRQRVPGGEPLQPAARGASQDRQGP